MKSKSNQTKPIVTTIRRRPKASSPKASSPPERPALVRRRSNRVLGIIKFYEVVQFYGFIQFAGQDYHFTSKDLLLEDIQALYKGCPCTFQPDTDEKGRHTAHDIRLHRYTCPHCGCTPYMDKEKSE